ncbi:MAG TPA: MurR/RpiR family transcriptional regulator [Steroidobacteraceae bacterium]|jgi:DNA-binding MurR/RpiR family transcriptional regulator|nr:MurR/RpiR family transcriptional regulator [Steroidobacteraceae bacterium]
MTKEDVEQLISERYQSLPPKLKLAARHVLDSPKDIAIQSMRSVAADAKLQPAAMLRLARELGFDSYEDFRALYVRWLSSSEMTFVARAKSLRKRRGSEGQEKIFVDMYDTEVVSLDRTLGAANAAAFEAAKEILNAARRFYVLGLRSLFPAAYYFDYACRLFSDKSVLVAGVGGAIADELRRATSKDALVAFSLEPYARLTVDAVRYAAERHVKIVAVTDSVVSPIVDGASVVLLAPNAGPALVPSILPAMAAAQALASLMVTAGGKATLGEIARSDAQLHRLHAYTDR